MGDVDVKKLDIAIIYLQRITDGKNPVNNMPAEEDAVLNNPNVIRCMFFVKDVLEAIRENGGYIGKKPSRKERERALEDFPIEILNQFEYVEDKTITQFVKQLNMMVDGAIHKQLKYKAISNWLKQNDYLKTEYNEELKKDATIPTQRGLQIGIRSEKRIGSSGNVYLVVIYGKQAQKFLVENMGVILDESNGNQCNTLTEQESVND